MGELKVGNINFNNSENVDEVRSIISEIIRKSDNYYTLKFHPQYYFRIEDGPITEEGGWYIILNASVPIYVGKAENLNARLNTTGGSSDDFARKARTTDVERNFIKKFDEISSLVNLRVCIITRTILCTQIGLDNNSLSELDIVNVEKFLNIIRGMLTFL